MRFELIDGDPYLLTEMVRDGWKIVNTFPNPYPQPYFYALLSLEHPDEDNYDFIAIIENRHRVDENKLPKWDLEGNKKKRSY